jgi:surface carbohydrate biosynthesis protein
MNSQFNKNTKTNKQSLLLPVENQVRELDAKILLGYVAAHKGFVSILGPRRKLESQITSFPKSIYISKSLKSGNGRYFKILRKLGHEIVAWDEEALVHLPPETYFSRRFSLEALKHVSHLFAWGQDSADLWRQCPDFPNEKPIHITGNPRGDLLRPGIRHFYDKIIKEIKERYGDFILINTNFSQVNAFYPVQNLFQPVKRFGEKPKLGNAAEGMTREYAQGLWDHRRLIFEDFKRLIPKLEKAFPDYNIVVRPHPGENQKVYHRIASQCQRVRVTNEGNVIPWLIAAKAMVHNGCTTGVEAYVLGLPAISYRATVNDQYDDAFHYLPNLLSYECFDSEALSETLQKVLSGQIGIAIDNENKKIIDHHLASQTGALACECIVDILNNMSNGTFESPKSTLNGQLKGRYLIIRRRFLKRYRSLLSMSHKKPELLRHNYPGISIEELLDRISRFQRVLGYKNDLRVDQIYKQIYRISL